MVSPQNMTYVFFHKLFDTKDKSKNILWVSCYNKIDFKVKYI